MSVQRVRWWAAMVLVLMAFPAAGQQQQQEGWVTVSEPGEWSEGGMLNVASGTRIRVVGQAFHRGGVRAVRIGNQDAQVRAAPGGVVDFEGTFVTTGSMRELIITIVPNQGNPVRRTLNLTITGGGGGVPAAQPPEPRATSNLPSAGSAMATSFIVPGLGQFRTRRPVLGALFLAGAGASLGVGIASTKTTIRCRAGVVGGACPAGQEAGEETSKPMLVPGIVGFLVLGAISGFEASSYIKRNSGGGGDQNNHHGIEAGFDPVTNAPMLRITLKTLRF